MAVKITAAALRVIAPGAADPVVDGIVRFQHLLPQYGIDTVQRVKCFLGQSATETSGFTRLEENLYYTTSRRVRQVWPSRFPTDSSTAPYLRNPQKLANKVYGGRLGNVGPNDGWLYRGSGCKQVTGRYNFGVVKRVTGLDVVAHPEWLRRFHEALESACIYWHENNLNRFADAGDIAGLTRAIQGGSGGLADRRLYTDRAGRVNWETGDTPVVPMPPVDDTSEPILRMGDRGSAVRRAQKRLAAHGYEIRVDGIFGGGTDNIVREFQERQGLVVDGVIGPVTWRSLNADPTAGTGPGRAPNFIDFIIALLASIFGRK